MFFMDSLVSIGDLFADAHAFIRGGAIVTFVVPGGWSAVEVQRHLARRGIKSWGLRYLDGEYAVNVPKEKAFIAQRELERMR